MGKYLSYPEYIDSKIDWVGQVPKHWELVPLRAVLNFRNEKNDPQKTDNVLSLSIAHGVTEYSEENRVGGNKKKDDLTSYKLAYPNDIVMNSMNIIVGAVGVSKYFGAISPVYYALYADCHSVCLSYYASIFDNSGFQKGLLRFGKGILMKISDNGKLNTIRMKVSQDDLKVMYFPKPPYAEQEKIAKFLDHETAKIDTLIEKQQQLIKLLKEKRQAVISHVVTKGLNPNAPMRDSGVDWLGEVPEHWVVAQLKFNTLEMQTGPFGSQLHAEDYVVDGIPLINPAHMISGKIIPDSKVSVDEETQSRLGRHKLSEGEIIFARRGELGRCAIVTKEQEGWLCGTGSLKAKLNDRLIPEYAYLLITSDGVVSELSLESKGSTMDNLNTETLGRVRMPVPPESEQNDVLQYVDEVSGKFKSLISNAETAIVLMQERRTALISAAVTGKIDVRYFNSEDGQPPKPSGNQNKEVAA